MFLADRTNGRAIGTLLRLSVCRRRRLSVIVTVYFRFYPACVLVCFSYAM